MNRESFLHLCMEAEAGRDAFVMHPSSKEEGLVTACSLSNDRMVVRTAEGHTRCWDYHHCRELHPAVKSSPMG